MRFHETFSWPFKRLFWVYCNYLERGIVEYKGNGIGSVGVFRTRAIDYADLIVSFSKRIK